MRYRVRQQLKTHSLASSDSAIIRVLSLDVLAALRAVPGQFPKCKKASLVWANRQRLISEELKEYDADVLLLQDVDRYEDFWQRFLGSIGFDSYVGLRRDSSGIGSAICWRRSSLRPVRTETIHLADCASSVSAASDRIRLERLSDMAVAATLMPRRYLGERPRTQNTGRGGTPMQRGRSDSPVARVPSRGGSPGHSSSGASTSQRASSPLVPAAAGGAAAARPASPPFPVTPWGDDGSRGGSRAGSRAGSPQLAGHDPELGPGGRRGGDGLGVGLLPAGEACPEQAQSPMVSLNEGHFPPRLRPLGSPIHLVAGTLLHAEPDGQNQALRRLRCLQAKYLCHRVAEFTSQYGACPIFLGVSAGAVPGSEAHCALRLGRVPRAPQPPTAPVRPASVPVSSSACIVAWPAPSRGAQGDAPVRAFRVLGRLVAEAGEAGMAAGESKSADGGPDPRSPSRGSGGVWAHRMTLSAADAALTGRLRVMPVPVASSSSSPPADDWREGPQLLAAVVTGLPSGSSWQFRVVAESKVGQSPLSAPCAAVVLPAGIEQAVAVGIASRAAGLTEGGGGGGGGGGGSGCVAVGGGRIVASGVVAPLDEGGADSWHASKRGDSGDEWEDVRAASPRQGEDAVPVPAAGRPSEFEWALGASGQRAADASAASVLVARKGGVAAGRRVRVVPPPEWVLPQALGRRATGASQDLAAQQGMGRGLAGTKGTAVFAQSRPGEQLADTIMDDAAGGRDTAAYREDGSLVPPASVTGSRPMPEAQAWHPRALAGAARDAALGTPAGVRRSREEQERGASAGAGGCKGEAPAAPRPQDGAPVSGEGTAVGSEAAARALARSLPVHELGLRSAYEQPAGDAGGPSGLGLEEEADGRSAGSSGAAADADSVRTGREAGGAAVPRLHPVPDLIPPSLPGHWTMWAPVDTLGRDSADTLQLPLDGRGYAPEEERREFRRGVPGSEDQAFEVDYLLYAAAAAVPVAVVLAPERGAAQAASRPASPLLRPAGTAGSGLRDGTEEQLEEEGESELDAALGGLFGGGAAGILGLGGAAGGAGRAKEPAAGARAQTPAGRRREGLPDADYASHHVALCADFAVLPGVASATAIK